MAEGLSTEAISRAARLLRPVVRRTPLEPSTRLSGQLGVPVLLTSAHTGLGIGRLR